MHRQIIIYLIIIFFSGCSFIRKIDRNVLLENGNNELSEIEKLERNNIYNKSVNFEKIRVTIENENEKKEFLINAKIKGKDSILISLRSLTGIEIARMLLANDSIKINDRINKKFYTGKEDDFVKKYKVSRKAIFLLFGDFIYSKIIDYKDCIDDNSGGYIKVLIDNKRVNYLYDCKLNKVKKANIIGEIDSMPVTIEYLKFKRYGKYWYPNIVKVTGYEKDSKIEIIIKDIIIPYTGNLKFTKIKNYESVIIE